MAPLPDVRRHPGKAMATNEMVAYGSLTEIVRAGGMSNDRSPWPSISSAAFATSARSAFRSAASAAWPPTAGPTSFDSAREPCSAERWPPGVPMAIAAAGLTQGPGSRGGPEGSRCRRLVGVVSNCRIAAGRPAGSAKASAESRGRLLMLGKIKTDPSQKRC